MPDSMPPVRKRRSFSVTTSHCELDAPPGDSLKRATFYGDDRVIYDWVQERAVEGPAPKFPRVTVLTTAALALVLASLS